MLGIKCMVYYQNIHLGIGYLGIYMLEFGTNLMLENYELTHRLMSRLSSRPVSVRHFVPLGLLCRFFLISRLGS